MSEPSAPVEAEPFAAWGDWDAPTRNDPYPLFASMRSQCPVHQVQLADGHEAWLVLGHDAARQALKDARLSKDMVAALDADPDVVAAGLPGPAFSRHMLNVDPPDHTRLRRLVARARSRRRGSPHSNRRSRASPANCSTRSRLPVRTRSSTSSEASHTRCPSA